MRIISNNIVSFWRQVKKSGRGKTEVGDQRSEIGGRRSEGGGLRTDGWMIRMNRMLGWKKPGDKDKVITTDVGGRRSEVGGQRSEVAKQTTQQFDITIKDTNHLIGMIQNNELPDKIMINVHPQRWNDEFIPWFSELVRQNVKKVRQNVKNVIKRILVKRNGWLASARMIRFAN